jgi:GNAT superfamily N-acetyltransferase
MRADIVIAALAVDEMTPEVLEAATAVTAEAQLSRIRPSAWMFLLNFNTTFPFVGSACLCCIALAGMRSSWNGKISTRPSKLSLRQALITSLWVAAKCAALLAAEWFGFTFLIRWGFESFVSNRTSNPIVNARNIFLINDAKSKFFVARTCDENAATKLCGVALMICGPKALEFHGDIPLALILGREDVTAIVRFVGVLPEMHGHGIGRSLMSSVVAAARAAGCQQVLLHTESLMMPAVRMYLNMGFRIVRRKSLVHTVGYEMYVMQLNLSDAMQ